MSLNSLFRFKRSNDGFEVKYIIAIYCHILVFLIRHSFTEIKHYATDSNKITMYITAEVWQMQDLPGSVDVIGVDIF